MVELAGEAAGPGLGLPDVEAADVAKLGALLRRHQLDKVRTLTGYADGRWCLRAFW